MNQRPEGLVEDRSPELADDDRPIAQPRLGPIGWLRFIWRQLTSMRTALFLLMLLAVAAIPGSVLPQNRIDPARVESWLNDHPAAGPWLQRVGAFDVYSSVWFSAVYLLLFISLVGCVVPRARLHLKAIRATPPRAPRRLDRMPAVIEAPTGASPDDVLAAARTALAARRYRLAPQQDGDDAVSAERGHWAETGNLLFHLGLLAVLVAMAVGSFVTYSGQSVVITGKSWTNQLLQYDAFTPGRAVDTDDLPAFSLTLNSMTVKFDSQSTGNQFGAPREFKADVAYQESPGAPVQHKTIQVNDPLKVDGASVYLVGNGYAPRITVRNAAGTAVYSGATPFQPIDGKYTSSGVIKIPDGLSKQLGLVGNFIPTLAQTSEGMPVNVYPDAQNPALLFTAYAGDLGVNTGVPQSVYALDASKMTQLTDGQNKFSALLKPGQTTQLPGGLGSVTFDGYERYAAFDVRHDPTKIWVLIAAVAALIGLTLSLFVHRRRVWVRAVAGPDGRTVVQVAGLSRSEDGGLRTEVEELTAELPVYSADDEGSEET